MAMAISQNHRLSCDSHFDYLGCMRLCISIALILLVTTPVVAAVITVREQTPDRPIVVVVEGSLAAFDEDQFGSLLAGLRIGEALFVERDFPQPFQRADVAHRRVPSRGWGRGAFYWD